MEIFFEKLPPHLPVDGDNESFESLSTSTIRVCLVGQLYGDQTMVEIARSYGTPITATPFEPDTVHVTDNFEGELFAQLSEAKVQIIGPTALKQLTKRRKALPLNTRPVYTYAMAGVVVCFTGFRKDDIMKLGPLVHQMGGSIRKDMSVKVTHLIANASGGEKYAYAGTFGVPIMQAKWVYDAWNNRNDENFSATEDSFQSAYRLKPFYGTRVCFYGFIRDEEKHMIEVLEENGGLACDIDDPQCTHVVVDNCSPAYKADNRRVWIVKAEWFWTSVQKEFCLDEKDYLYRDCTESYLSPLRGRRDSAQTTPLQTPNHAHPHYCSHRSVTPSSLSIGTSRRKRKRLHDTLVALAAHQQSPGLHKRRSSISDAGLLSVSNSFIDSTLSPAQTAVAAGGNAEVCGKTEGAATANGTVTAVTDTPPTALRKTSQVTARQQVFEELLQTESNYVNILHTIMTMFKKHLEDMPEHEALLNNTELNLIFGKIPPIYETHLKMLTDLRYLWAHWSDEHSLIGNVIVNYSSELLKAYPPFINYFEEMKEVLSQCDQNKPRFHAFLKVCQTKPECGRQSLQELMIRPVQRLGSITLLLNDILKNTPKTYNDHAALDQALAALREVMTHINEDKRKTEGQVTIFNIFNEIDNCPPDIVSSHRSLITATEVIQLSSDGLSSRGNVLILFLFTDQLEVCKKKSKAFNNLKSPAGVAMLPPGAPPAANGTGTVAGLPNVSCGGSVLTTSGTGTMSGGSGSLQRSVSRLYKHVKLIPLNSIKRVIDIKETDECQRVFSLVCRHTDDPKERLYSFVISPESDFDKLTFLKTLTRTMANNACTADADKFLAYLEPHQLNIDTSDVSNGSSTLSKAFKFASRTKMKVGRAFSFNKTPSKLKRAVSSMMSPFESSSSVTPASQLAQMRLASCNNINELGSGDSRSLSTDEESQMAHIQSSRKLNSASLSAMSR